jgi:PAS domain S-box-containing protein
MQTHSERKLKNVLGSVSADIVIDGLPGLFYMCDTEGKFTRWNQNDLKLTGYTDEDVPNLNALDIISPEHRKLALDKMLEAFNNGVATAEIDILTKTGEKIPHHITAKRVSIGEKTYLVGMGIDITDRKKAEEALVASEVQLRASLENAPDGVYMNDLEGNFLYGNRRCEEISGYKREELIGKNFLEVNLLPNDSLTRAAELFQYIINGESTGSAELELIRKDSRRVPIEIRANSVRHKGQTVILSFVRDITERRQAEQALRESEAQYRLLSEHMADGLLLLDMNLKITYISPSVEKIRGFTPLEAMEMPLEQHITPESLKLASEMFLEELPKVVADPAYNPIPMLELEYYCKDGTTVWTENKFSIIRDSSGKPLSILGEVRDITDRKRAEETLQKTENIYRLLAENIHDVVWMMDMDLNVTWLSPSSVKVRGFSVDETIALPLDKQLTPESLGKAVNLWGKWVHIEQKGRTPEPNGTISMDLEFYCKDGHTVLLDCTLQFIRDKNGKATGILAAGRDITERRAAERAREESEKNYRLLAENTTDVVTIMNMDLNITWLSSSCEKLTGYSSEEQKYLPIEKQMTQESFEKALKQFIAELEREKSGTAEPDRYQDMELEIYHKDGHTLWTENRIRFIRDDQGKAVGILMQGRDITARKQAEEALKKTMQDLRRSNEDLEQFAYVASHDLQEPLRMVSSYVQLLEKRYKDNLDGDAHDFINYAVSGSRRMQNLINDLLSYSRVGMRGKPFQQMESSDALAAAVSNLEVAMREVGAVVEHGELPRVVGDEGQLVQVFQNLVGNAVKFHGEAPPLVRVDAVRNDGNWVFSVNDNGIGIDPQFFERIFLVFQRLHGNEYPGTGIGLSVTQKIVQRHGGQMWLESEPGKGAKFYFTIPVREKGGKTYDS